MTGAGSRIGRATAQALARRGLSVLCVGRRPEPLRETASSIGDGARGVSADVSTDKGTEAVRDAVASDSVACVVHAAAVEGLLTLAETDRETFNALVATNLGGPFLVDACPAAGVRRRELRRLRREHRRVSRPRPPRRVRRDEGGPARADRQPRRGARAPHSCQLHLRRRHAHADDGAGSARVRRCGRRDRRAAALGGRETPRLLLGVAEPAQIAASISFLALDATSSTGTVLYADGGYTAR